jgi:N6-L-threonylcarbamoyladenine synthase
MRILAIETSCDETGAAVVEKHHSEQFVRVLSNITATSSKIHAKTGGVIPEFAAREQVKAIIPVIARALNKSRGINHESWKNARRILAEDIDAIAITHGPGLIGSLLVGTETAKALSFGFKKPLVPVHHLLAHLFANWLTADTPSFPFIGLIVSGGHTDLLFFESVSKFKWLGGTRDDAAGEALDKIGRLLGLAYPAGPEIERRANKFSESRIMNQESRIKFQSPLINSEGFDFSFSGLKTEAARYISTMPAGRQAKHLAKRLVSEICCAIQDAVFKVLVKKTIRAVKLYNVSQIVIGGGVSANQTLINGFKSSIINNKLSMRIFSPEKQFATDNAAMIGAYALLNYQPVDWDKITALPELYFN